MHEGKPWPRSPLPRSQWTAEPVFRYFASNRDEKFRLQQRYSDFDSQSSEWRDIPVIVGEEKAASDITLVLDR